MKGVGQTDAWLHIAKVRGMESAENLYVGCGGKLIHIIVQSERKAQVR